MAQMLIRNLDDFVVAQIKARAERNQTSAEEEARRALIASFGFDPETWLRESQALRERIGPLVGPTSTEMLQAARDRDNDR